MKKKRSKKAGGSARKPAPKAAKATAESSKEKSTEIVFSYPGLGTLTLGAIPWRKSLTKSACDSAFRMMPARR